MRKRLRSKVELARELRQRAATAERLAWRLLRNRRLLGYKFRRQHVLRGFIVDFYCAELRLAIEMDGGVHGAHPRRDYDTARTAALERHSIHVVRIASAEVTYEELERLVLAEAARHVVRPLGPPLR